MKAKTKELADSVGAVYPTLFLGRHDGVLFTETELETFVNLVAAAEREACAKLCEDFTAIKRAAFNSASGRDPRFFLAMSTRKFCAKVIRARGNT